MVIDQHAASWRRSDLPDDNEWCHLVELLTCRIGERLFAIDETDEGDGWRLSTPIRSIHRED